MNLNSSAESVPQRHHLVWLAAIGLILAALLAWDSRYEGDPDGISYLNIAEQVTHGNFNALSNPYWSPLYPALNAVLLLLFRPRPENALPLMHLAGYLMFAAATASFLYFLAGWRRAIAARVGDPLPGSGTTIAFFSWCIFLWVSLRLVSVVYPLPDMLTFATLLLAAGVCCRIVASGGRVPHYALLGLVLGVGYLGKFSVAPATAVLFLLMLVLAKNHVRELRNLAIAGAVFCIIAAPQVIGVSRRVGRLSLGEAGRLNYAWHVNRTPFLWAGPDGFAADTRVRVLNAQPLVFEFADSSGGTLPVWYDPAYWQGRLPARVSPRELLVSLEKRTEEAFRIFEDIVPLLVGLLVLAFGSRKREPGGAEPGVRLLGLWAVLTCAIFMLVHVEYRYIATAVFLIALVLYRRAERVADWTAFAVAARIVGLVTLLPLVPPTERAVMHLGQALAGRIAPAEHVTMAAQLHELGIASGDRIAVAGYAYEDYYAQVAGVQISAQVCDAATYADVDWHDPALVCRAAALFRRGPEFLAPAWDALRRAGVKAVITRDAPADCLPTGWRRLGERYAILIL
jgi:hypothetical protein